MPVTPSMYIEHEVEVAMWVGETGTGVAANVTRYPGLTVQVVGTGTVAFQGSNDNVNWVTLRDATAANTAMSAVAAGTITPVLEQPLWVRPVVSGGTATIILAAKSGR